MVLHALQVTNSILFFFLNLLFKLSFLILISENSLLCFILDVMDLSELRLQDFEHLPEICCLVPLEFMEVFDEECFLSISVSDQIIHCEDALCQIHLQSVHVWHFRVNITAVFLNNWFNM